MSIFIRTVPNVMAHFGCSADDAHRYIDLRDEGYTMEQAALMAGLSDPPDNSRWQERLEEARMELSDAIQELGEP